MSEIARKEGGDILKMVEDIGYLVNDAKKARKEVEHIKRDLPLYREEIRKEVEKELRAKGEEIAKEAIKQKTGVDPDEMAEEMVKSAKTMEDGYQKGIEEMSKMKKALNSGDPKKIAEQLASSKKELNGVAKEIKDSVEAIARIIPKKYRDRVQNTKGFKMLKRIGIKIKNWFRKAKEKVNSFVKKHELKIKGLRKKGKEYVNLYKGIKKEVEKGHKRDPKPKTN
eukprot:TRINITY_DN21085_c0_g1_i1.p1 TRINITY_DN21085_c0_g1~~TRINITY_DN21085_c0_g1_i1.p1  ORF type:complete len:225 (-),score=13.50 TRINITY_DN21085_c0_g1_i1:127-801(-)